MEIDLKQQPYTNNIDIASTLSSKMPTTSTTTPSFKLPKLLSPLGSDFERLLLPPPALPDGLCFEDRGQGQLQIMPVMTSRARQWVDDLYLGDAFKPIIPMKKRRAANVTSKQRTKQVLLENSQSSSRKRRFKAKTQDEEIQETIYWAPIAPECASTIGAFIDAMSVDLLNRSREEERIIDSYFSSGMSLDPILKTEKITKTNSYLQIGHKGLKRKDHQDRGIEDGDLDKIDSDDNAATAWATKYQKIKVEDDVKSARLTTNLGFTYNVQKMPSIARPAIYMKRSQDI